MFRLFGLWCLGALLWSFGAGTFIVLPFLLHSFRYFVSQTATTIVDIQDQKLVRYEGDYRYYLEKHKDVEEKVSTRYIAGSAGIQSARVIDQESMQKQKQKQKMSKHLSQKGNLSSGKKGKGVKNAKRSAL